jgi:integrase
MDGPIGERHQRSIAITAIPPAAPTRTRVETARSAFPSRPARPSTRGPRVAPRAVASLAPREYVQEAGEVEPKSATSVRTVPLLAVLRDYLDEHLLATGRSGDDLVFGRTAADPFAPTTVAARADKAWAMAKLERITLHECRHTFASLLIAAGENPKAVQEFLGHATITMTFDLYGHLLPGSRNEAREGMDAYLAAEDAALGEMMGK